MNAFYVALAALKAWPGPQQDRLLALQPLARALDERERSPPTKLAAHRRAYGIDSPSSLQPLSTEARWLFAEKEGFNEEFRESQLGLEVMEILDTLEFNLLFSISLHSKFIGPYDQIDRPVTDSINLVRGEFLQAVRNLQAWCDQ